jgi:hypothetical protein
VVGRRDYGGEGIGRMVEITVHIIAGYLSKLVFNI